MDTVMNILRRVFPRWVPLAYWVNGCEVTRAEYLEALRLHDLWQEPLQAAIEFPCFKTRWWDRWIDKIDPSRQ